MRIVRALVVVGSVAAATAGCDSDSDSAKSTVASTDTVTAGSDTTSSDTTPVASDFKEGNFQLTTKAVQDTCVDGALEIVFMPNGTDKPYDLAELTKLPSASSLPQTYDITLQAPFSTMNVTVEADGGNMKISKAAQAAVKVDETQWPGCTADMTVDAAITILSADSVTVNTDITVTNWKGDKCPTATNGCHVKLDMSGVRKN